MPPPRQAGVRSKIHRARSSLWNRTCEPELCETQVAIVALSVRHDQSIQAMRLRAVHAPPSAALSMLPCNICGRVGPSGRRVSSFHPRGELWGGQRASPRALSALLDGAEALLPARHVFQRVEAGRLPVRAVDAHADAVAHHVQVLRTLRAELLEALPEEEVLAPGLPLELPDATVLVLEVARQSRLGDGLNRAEHHRLHAVRLVAVDDVDVLADELRQVRPEALGDDERVGVDLHNKVVVAPGLVELHPLPGVHEELGVPRRPVPGPADFRGLEGLDLHRAPGRIAHLPRLVPRAEERVPVAREDADGPHELGFYQGGLVALGHEDGEAEQRRQVRPGRPGAQPVALPARRVPVGRLREAGALGLARRPVPALGEALQAGLGAAPRLHARATFCALLLDPRRRGHVPDGDHLRHSRRPGAQRLAAPPVAVGISRVWPCDAVGPACCPSLFLHIALSAR
mmetsp:Transcript_45515/g.128755  ORF Transcript_45515/g.128755 Transcript_45515/m.128755 type:complete len:459 (-) Transcript_45515:233-1609(-)